MRLKLFRWKDGDEQHHYDIFDLDPVPGMTILSVLFQIQEQYDESLAFRYSCRGAVCGTCAMLVNRIPRLACRTQILALSREQPPPSSDQREDTGPRPSQSIQEIVIEPLPHLPVIRDLIVDMGPFFKKLQAVDPVFRPDGPDPESERLMDQAEVKELEKYTNCILCGACDAACPVEETSPEFLGPAALARLYRFHIDPRESRGTGRLIHADNLAGWWGCKFHSRCRAFCPKGVTPDIAIARARRELTQSGHKPEDRQENDTN